ncbi:putative epimerase/dehydratase WbiI [Bacteriovorax sp. BSW11_IV]|uniref:polysaccharide biosynthesis protein n=1 Tax=Bacteriovorax sp. BSW11_IV TaxID=1353529 RepID=UPI00038A1B6D|nr:nucleoside-diphosphate sugar epimerase/dehydratase [Bacteriovorax sp. BSW11_IV]EQC45839.1 putative epimerase/dehydratase WbiI [Bacteriovorax sp. BSW11_IV]
MLNIKYKRTIAFIYDSSIVVATFPLATALRYGSFSNPVLNQTMTTKILIILLCHQVIFLITGQYKGIWRYASTHDLIQIIKSSSIGLILTLTLFFFTHNLDDVPRSSFIIYYLLNIILLSAGRFSYRLYKDSLYKNNGDNTLIVGAGDAGSQLYKSIKSSHDTNLKVVGFLDDDRSKKGRLIHGCPIMGTSDDIATLVDQRNVKTVIIAIPSANAKEVSKIVSKIPQLEDLKVKILPSMSQLTSEFVDISLIKDIDPEDLLGRRPVRLDTKKISEMIQGKSILITGAAGSIGSELCNQVLSFKPQKLVLLDTSEFGLYEIDRKLAEKCQDNSIEIVPAIGNICDHQRIKELLIKHDPEVVLHAAAYKHVPLMEGDARECIKNNVFGTETLVRACAEHRIKKFVLVSTDKAVNPTNIMGASKRTAEMICQHYSISHKDTNFTTVRFGNVLGSKGSVVPLFKEQIKNGGPITITHQDITRYFMSIPEACQLVLQAATLGKGGDIFVLDMGEPIKITRLAEELIKLSGLRPYEDIEIKFTGLRPGEKLYEELFNSSEAITDTAHTLVKSAAATIPETNFIDRIRELEKTVHLLNNNDIKLFISDLIKTYSPELNKSDDNEIVQ